MRVDPEEIVSLGRSLLLLTEELACEQDVGAERFALGPGSTAGALDELLTGWRLERLRLAEALYALGDAAGCAGMGYAEVEASATSAWGGLQP